MSMIRVVRSQTQPGYYNCIDGMHRASALQYLLINRPEIFKDSHYTCHVFDNVPQDMQCQLADSNIYILLYIKFKLY